MAYVGQEETFDFDIPLEEIFDSADEIATGVLVPGAAMLSAAAATIASRTKSEAYKEMGAVAFVMGIVATIETLVSLMLSNLGFRNVKSLTVTATFVFVEEWINHNTVCKWDIKSIDIDRNY